MKSNSTRIVILDIIRIAALLTVILNHVLQYFKSPLGSFFGIPNFYYVTLGGLAVSVFLILSGLVLQINYAHKKIDYKQFLIKRLSYIYPIYWYSLIIGIVVFLALNGVEATVSKFTKVTQLFFLITGSFSQVGQWGGPFIDSSWFIGLIISLYVVYPLLHKFNKLSPFRTLITCLIISLICRLVLGQDTILPNRAIDWFPLCRLFEFSLGVYLAGKNRIVGYLASIKVEKLSSIISYLSDVSFPAFLIHHPLLKTLDILIPRFGVGLSLLFYGVMTLSLSTIVLLMYKYGEKTILAKKSVL